METKEIFAFATSIASQIADLHYQEHFTALDWGEDGNGRPKYSVTLDDNARSLTAVNKKTGEVVLNSKIALTVGKEVLICAIIFAFIKLNYENTPQGYIDCSIAALRICLENNPAFNKENYLHDVNGYINTNGNNQARIDAEKSFLYSLA